MEAVQMVQTFTAVISILGDADSARSSVAVGLTCEGEGERPVSGGGISGGGYPPSCVAVGLTCEGEGERPVSGGGILGGGYPPSCSCTVGSCSCSVDLTPLVSHVCD